MQVIVRVLVMALRLPLACEGGHVEERPVPRERLEPPRAPPVQSPARAWNLAV